MSLPDSTYRLLRVDLSAKELKAATDSIVEALKMKDQYEGELKTIKAQYKAKIEENEAKINKLRQTYEDGYEMRSVECRIERDFDKNEKKIFRNDTGKTVECIAIPSEERQLIDRALNGFEGTQSLVISPLESLSSAQLSYIATYLDEDEQVKGMLIGRSDLSNNPYAPPMLVSLNSLEDIGGEGILLDEEGKILYHTDTNRVMEIYSGKVTEGPAFFDDTAYDGTRQLVYFYRSCL